MHEPYLRQHDEAHKEGEEADPEEEELPAVFTSEQGGMHVDYRCHEALNTHELMGQARQEVICSYFGSNVSCKSDMLSIVEEKECVFTHLAVEPQKHNHDEEKCGPQSGERHHAHGAGVSDEGQARTCKDQNDRCWFQSQTLAFQSLRGLLDLVGGAASAPLTRLSYF